MPSAPAPAAPAPAAPAPAAAAPVVTIPPSPKGFFANERTFLSWMSMTLMLGAVSIGLLNFGGTFSHIVAIVFGVLTTALMFYSLIQFNKRGDQLQKKDKGLAYEDMVGSLVMVTVVFVAVAVNFGVHFIYNRN